VSTRAGASLRTAATLRCLLFLALVTGLAGMHVFAIDDAAGCRPTLLLSTSDTSASASASASTSGTAPGAASAAGIGHAGALSAAVRPASAASSADHAGTMQGMERCTFVLATGVAVLIALGAQGAARVLRSSPALSIPWTRVVRAIAPRRGPPLPRWPRIALCILRI
jgi:hypothetical protein